MNGAHLSNLCLHRIGGEAERSASLVAQTFLRASRFWLPAPAFPILSAIFA